MPYKHALLGHKEFLSGDYRGTEDADIVDRAVIIVAHLALDAIGHLHAFYHFAKDGIATVKMGCATLAGYNVKLTGTGKTGGIDIVALTGCGNRAIAMMDSGQTLGQKPVRQITITQQFAWLSMPAVGVACLYHEVRNDTVEKQRVIEMFSYEFQEVVAVAGCLVVELDADVALGSLKEHLGTRDAVLRQNDEGCKTEDEKE